MTWITVDTELPDHAKMASLPNDSARYGWLVTLCKAKKQTPPGGFASARHYGEVMGRFGRFLPAYVKAHLMDEDEAGALSIHDWDRHQWKVKKQGQRGDTEGTRRGPTYTETDTETFKSLKRPIARVDTAPQRLADLLPRNYVAELRKAQAE